MVEPAVSVIVPVYNPGPFLDAALRSVLRQEGPSFEVIAVDDGSSDGSAERLSEWTERDPRVRTFRIDNRGPAGARNFGLAQARGRLVAFIDADDLWPPGKLALQVGRLDADPRLVAVSGFTCWFDRADAEGLTPAVDARSMVLFHVHLGAAIFRREVLQALRGLDESLRFSEDMDLYMRLREEKMPFVILREVTLYYRRHPASLTGKRSGAADLQLFDMLRLSLARRRARGALGELAPLESHIER